MDNNYNVHFSRGDCLMQDQVSRMVIAKEPKVGYLFPLQFSIPNVVSLVCMAIANMRSRKRNWVVPIMLS